MPPDNHGGTPRATDEGGEAHRHGAGVEGMAGVWIAEARGSHATRQDNWRPPCLDPVYIQVYTSRVSPAEAIQVIRECVDAERAVVKDHFMERLAERGFFWGDVLAVLESPSGIRDDGLDEFGRERWLVTGKVAEAYRAEILCVIDTDGPTTLFITLYWEN